MIWLTQWFQGEAKLVQLAERLAAHCHEQVWQHVRLQAVAMSPAEARGYIRARASLVVKHTVQATLAESRQFASASERLRDLTTEYVIRLISAQLRALRPARTRRAA